MRRGDDLREGLRLGAISLVTARTQDCGIGQLRDYGSRIFGVSRQRAVTGFAADPNMFAFALYFGLFGVAGFASFPPGEFNGSRTDFFERAGPEVAILAEFGRDDDPPDHQESGDPCHQQDYYTD
jgi:hypothetical protein